MTAACFRREETAGSLDLFSWLHAMPLFPKIYWANRERNSIIAGCGIAESSPSSPLFSWRPFSETKSPEWNPFFSLGPFPPRLTIKVQEGQTRFEEMGTLSFDSLFKRSSPLSSTQYQICKSQHVPEKEAWIRNINHALSKIREGLLEKIVLARKVDIDCTSPIDPIALCRSIDGPGRTSFLFQPEPNIAFLGASPERLYKREGRFIECDAMAGTCPKGEEEHLLKSEKDLREFQVVKERILETLSPFCRTSLVASETSLRSTPTLTHFYSKVTGELKVGVQDTDLLDALHPTAAVGGWPKKAALSEISLFEPFERGLYAAPIGWSSPDAAEFAVAIRSCLIHHSRASLFAGTGIVEGSDPMQEWEESANKLVQWNSVFKSLEQ